ncbi:MAG: hypothetical protein WBF79_14000 [Rhodococcus sp. (in: high G+C Gram-positive bacteria)]
MRALVKAACVVAATVSLSVMGSGTASAIDYPAPVPVDVGPYLQGDVAYFSSGSANCSITPAGVVGCDITSGAFLTQLPFAPRVYDVAIDVPWFPAHPTFGIGGPRGRGGSTPLAGSLTYGGATCLVGFKGALFCSSMGHSFTLWNPYLSVF